MNSVSFNRWSLLRSEKERRSQCDHGFTSPSENRTNPCVTSDHWQCVCRNVRLFPDDERREIHQCPVHYSDQHPRLSNGIESWPALVALSSEMRHQPRRRLNLQFWSSGPCTNSNVSDSLIAVVFMWWNLTYNAKYSCHVTLPIRVNYCLQSRSNCSLTVQIGVNQHKQLRISFFRFFQMLCDILQNVIE